MSRQFANKQKKKCISVVKSRPFFETRTTTTSSPETMENHRSSASWHTDQPTDQIFYRFWKWKHIAIRRALDMIIFVSWNRSLPYRMSVEVIVTRGCVHTTNTHDAVCKFEIDIYRSTHIHIYQLSSIIVTILLRIIICTNFMLRYKINDKTTNSTFIKCPSALIKLLPQGE